MATPKIKGFKEINLEEMLNELGLFIYNCDECQEEFGTPWTITKTKDHKGHKKVKK